MDGKRVLASPLCMEARGRALRARLRPGQVPKRVGGGSRLSSPPTGARGAEVSLNASPTRARLRPYAMPGLLSLPRASAGALDREAHRELLLLMARTRASPREA